MATSMLVKVHRKKANSTNKKALIYSFQIALDIDSRAADDIKE